MNEEGLEYSFIGGDGVSTYRIAVCDDDGTARETICSLCHAILTEDETAHEITAFSSADELKRTLSRESNPFDLLILDIQMEGMTGMELAYSLRDADNNVSIIFVTACDDYLPEGYAVQPVHFLLKPIDREILKKALRTDLKRNHSPKNVVLHIGGKTVNLPVADIQYIESANHELVVHQHGKTYSFYFSLNELEKQLPAGRYARCHKSYLVNLQYVLEIERNRVTLADGEELPVGRVYYQSFQSAFIRQINS